MNTRNIRRYLYPAGITAALLGVALYTARQEIPAAPGQEESVKAARTLPRPKVAARQREDYTPSKPARETTMALNPAWLAKYNVPLTALNEDADGDGRTNLQHMLENSDPFHGKTSPYRGVAVPTATADIVSSEVPGSREEHLRQMQAALEDAKVQGPLHEADTARIAAERGLPAQIGRADGNPLILRGFDSTGGPVYLRDSNINLADTSGLDELWPSGLPTGVSGWTTGSTGFNLTGAGRTVPIWENSGGVLTSHQQFGSRATEGDGAAPVNRHATKVAGVIASSGASDSFLGIDFGNISRGIAYEANITGYDYSYFDSEFVTEGIDGAQVANLSLEIAAGWSNVDGEWFWAGNDSYPESDLFGKYTDGTGVEPRHLDSRVALIQNFLPVLAASNSRGPDGLGDGPGSATYYTGPGGYTNTTKNWRNGDVGGYDTLPPSAVAKNSLVVGSTYSIDNGYASAAGVTIAPFSAFGPTDDGRIKPDIVAAGILNTASPRNTVGDEGAVETDFDSLDPSSGDLYDLFTGTSLSAAVVTGGLTLALEKRAEDRPDWSDFPLKASTLRALAVHTADEAGANPGPDYKFGYGLFNGRTLTQLVAADDAVDTKPNVKEVYISSLASESRFKVKAVSASKPLKVTIAWNDPAGTAAAAGVDPTQKKLTRDINLKVLDASGTTTTYPWVLNPDLTTKSATTRGAAATRGVDS
ncbi:MAG: scpA 1, partial [Akkermansiaceae bacterium]|nr:scpA 1 [Akkermansiaceae bacterium]